MGHFQFHVDCSLFLYLSFTFFYIPLVFVRAEVFLVMFSLITDILSFSGFPRLAGLRPSSIKTNGFGKCWRSLKGTDCSCGAFMILMRNGALGYFSSHCTQVPSWMSQGCLPPRTRHIKWGCQLIHGTVKRHSDLGPLSKECEQPAKWWKLWKIFAPLAAPLSLMVIFWGTRLKLYGHYMTIYGHKIHWMAAQFLLLYSFLPFLHLFS